MWGKEIERYKIAFAVCVCIIIGCVVAIICLASRDYTAIDNEREYTELQHAIEDKNFLVPMSPEGNFDENIQDDAQTFTVLGIYHSLKGMLDPWTTNNAMLAEEDDLNADGMETGDTYQQEDLNLLHGEAQASEKTVFIEAELKSSTSRTYRVGTGELPMSAMLVFDKKVAQRDSLPFLDPDTHLYLTHLDTHDVHLSDEKNELPAGCDETYKVLFEFDVPERYFNSKQKAMLYWDNFKALVDFSKMKNVDSPSDLLEQL